jgi:hypothetical protein
VSGSGTVVIVVVRSVVSSQGETAATALHAGSSSPARTGINRRLGQRRGLLSENSDSTTAMDAARVGG